MSPHHRRPPEKRLAAPLKGALGRRRAARVRLRLRAGQPFVVPPGEGQAERLIEAAEGLISATQRGFRRS